MSWFDKPKDNLIEPGEYDAAVFDVVLDRLNEPWKLSIQYKLENNRRVFQNFKFDEKGQKWITWQLGALGLNERAKEICDDMNDTHAVALAYFEAAQELKGRYVSIDVTNEEWQGKTYTKAKVLGVLETAPPTGNLAPSFDASEEVPF